jgi:uncharacterized phage-associated protein
MNSFPFSEEKAIAAVLYIAQKLGGSVDMHKLAKILYFADQKHLVTYGRTIIGDEYAPLDFGPVPSLVYDAVKAVNSNNPTYKLFASCLKIDTSKGHRIAVAMNVPDTGELSESDIECLDKSIAENGSLPFADLVEKSHKEAWTRAAEQNWQRLRIEDIATEAGASAGVVEYIKDNIADHNLVLT